MLSFSLLILCLNIDALSYGAAYGSKGKKLSLPYIFLITFMSTIMFSIPLGLSKYIFQYFNKKTLSIINGIILILLGISYIIPKNSDKEKNIVINKNFSFKQCFLECLAISVDAIFTALLSGFSDNYFLFCVIFYAFSNFVAIFCGNLFFFKLGSKLKFSIGFFSCFIFIFLGIFKMIGF